jgi:HTH-type transcriptional regulator / antitoxin HigA
MDNADNFQWASHPGRTIDAICREKGLSVEQLAAGVELSVADVLQLLIGDLAITPAIAKALAKAVGSSERFWLAREEHYKLCRQRLAANLDATEAAQWLKRLPIKDMQSWGGISKVRKGVDLAVDCLRFFGVASIDEWEDLQKSVIETTQFRTSTKLASDAAAVAAWIRSGELAVADRPVAEWNPALFKERLQAIRLLTTIRDPRVFLPQLQALCAEAGVALAVVRPPAGCRASGATKFLSPTRPLIMFSFRYLRDDAFWFTFFHESGHLLLHGPDRVFIEGQGLVDDQREVEANDFAAEVVIPPSSRKAFDSLSIEARAIIRFAKSIGIAPGLVVGQLQHARRLKWGTALNKLKRKYTWA